MCLVAWGLEERGIIKAIIYREDLTVAEHKAIEKKHLPYNKFEEFWTGFIDYQDDCNLPNRWPDNSVAGQAWDRGTEAAMRVHWERYRCEYARDDLDSRVQIATLDRLIERHQARKQQPRLIVDNTDTE